MSGSRMKKIRKEIYGVFDPRPGRQYSTLTKLKEKIIKGKDGKEEKVAFPRNTALSTGLHRKYRQAKKAYQERHRNGN
jgi:hypothetical protein